MNDFEKAIKEQTERDLYGDLYPQVKGHIDDDGWFPDDILGESFLGTFDMRKETRRR